MGVYIVPLSPEPQRLAVSLGGVTYRMSVRWNDHSRVWVVDVGNDAGVPIVSSVPLVTGCDLMEQYRHLGIGGELWAWGPNDFPPGYEDLGTSGGLAFVTMEGGV